MQHINQLNNIIMISSIIHNSLFNKIIKISFKLHHLILHLNPSSHLMTRLDPTEQMQRHDLTRLDYARLLCMWYQTEHQAPNFQCLNSATGHQAPILKTEHQVPISEYGASSPQRPICDTTTNNNFTTTSQCQN